MDACDVLIVGAGPAGSSCAWKLARSGLNVLIVDKQVFPRDKVCGGWITPPIVAELNINLSEYARGRILQPITGFRTGSIGGRSVSTNYGAPVSYGIRRREFDEFLLGRSGARVMQGVGLSRLERSGSGWIANGDIRAQMVVGAGGHFCPVAQLTGARLKGEAAVVAQEAEFEMNPEQQAGCAVEAEIPELYFCEDFKGYGWCFRKQNYLNVGLGRMDPQELPAHVADFVRFLETAGRISFTIPSRLRGHAYLLYGSWTRKIVDEALLLIGDAAGLAYSQSGEGIRPAIESGLLAASAIIAAGGKYGRDNLERYRAAIDRRFRSGGDWATGIGRRLPPGLIHSLGRRLLSSRSFTRAVVLDRWFLHVGEPALNAQDFAPPRSKVA